MDLLMEFFSRAQATSIARFRCVSKSWGSILGLPYFTELFLTMSRTRPRLLLFSFQVGSKIFFFSSPQPQNPDENSSLVATAYHVPHGHGHSPTFGSPLHGFICRRDVGELVSTVICNPVTGESISLPIMESRISDFRTVPYLGYDPIDKQFKVLCIKIDGISNTHKILTLENGNHLWRTINCKPHYTKGICVCVDGVLYYTAGLDGRKTVSMIVCFDVRSEKFSFIETEGSLLTSSCVLINYKGKLAALQFNFSSGRHLELWLLEDAVKTKWSKTSYTLPSSCTDALAIVGMTGRGEVVLSPLLCLSYPFSIYYFNLESNSFITVHIHGLEGLRPLKVNTYLGYAENLKLM